jgi:hypothetical protein
LHRVRLRRLAIAGVLLASATRGEALARAEELVRVFSHEDPAFDAATARLSVGRDGRVYLSSDRYLLSVAPDGQQKRGLAMSDALHMATAGADGTVATAISHFSHRVALWTRAFSPVGAVTDFLVDDRVGWQSPSDVEAAPSGAFYGIDSNRNRVLRIEAPDRTTATYSLANLGESLVGKSPQLRVWEGGKRFFVLSPIGTLRAIDFDGTLRWSRAVGVTEDPREGWRGGYDVDATGRVYVLGDGSDYVQVFERDGSPGPRVHLDRRPAKGRVSDLRLLGSDFVVKGRDAHELFSVYDARGALRRAVPSDSDEMHLKLSSTLWTAGAPAPVDVTLAAGSQQPARPWRVALRPLGTPEFAELPWHHGEVVAPADAGGLYQLRVSSGLEGGSGTASPRPK